MPNDAGQQLIYLDNNATTQPSPQVVAAMDEALRVLWGNPSSVHRFGQMVRQRVELARAAVAGLVNAKPRELIFTSGGTEANNMALRGILPGRDFQGGDFRGGDFRGGDFRGRVLITSKVEHSAVRQPAAALEREGVTVVWLPMDRHGRIAPEAVAQAMQTHTARPIEGGRDGEIQTLLVSVQWANNETGLVQPIEAIAQVVAEAKAALRSQRWRVVLHVDATQAVGKLPVDVRAVPVDLLTLAAHKFHGPKGVGALYVRTGERIRPVQLGGAQERDKRGGTENTAGIIGMGVAAELARTFLDDTDRIAALRALRDRFESQVLAELPDTVINAPDDDQHTRLWNTSNLGFPVIEAEAILLGLSERGVCASAGAACSSGSLDPSPVLLAMGIPEPVAHGSVRFSLGRETTAAEIDDAVKAVVEVVRRLSRTMPLGTVAS